MNDDHGYDRRVRLFEVQVEMALTALTAPTGRQIGVFERALGISEEPVFPDRHRTRRVLQAAER